MIIYYSGNAYNLEGGEAEDLFGVSIMMSFDLINSRKDQAKRFEEFWDGRTNRCSSGMDATASLDTS